MFYFVLLCVYQIIIIIIVKVKVKGLDIYILPLTGKPRPAAVYIEVAY